MFNTFKVKKPQRSTFSLNHKHETTVNIGDINCLHWNWCFPGDRFKIKYSFLCKFAPMIAPNFSRMRIKSEVFYVPLSDLYPKFHDVMMNYKEEISETVENGTRTVVRLTKLPHITLDSLAWWLAIQPTWANVEGVDFFDNLGEHTFMQQAAVERLSHQMGIPFDVARSQIPVFGDSGTNFIANPYQSSAYYSGDAGDIDSPSATWSVNGALPINIAPFQAYQYCYNWYYRDSVRSPEIDIYPDYQAIPITTDNDLLLRTLNSNRVFHAGYATERVTNRPQTLPPVSRFFNSVFQIRRRFYRKDYFNTAVSDPTVAVDSIAVPENIVDLRKANQLQKFIEKRALSGNRVAEFIMAHWAHKADDYELGKPILISSSSQNVQISEVLQTSQTTDGDDGSAQGSRSGVGNSYGSSNGSYFVAPDYGILLINMSIVPEISYFSGLPRKFTPYRWEHFPWPEFAQIGMQPIYDFELGKASADTVTSSPLLLEDQNVFGYAPRYSEFKQEPDIISGELATSLRFWHQSPVFETAPKLNKNFGLVGMFDYNQLFSPAQAREAAFQYYNQIFAVQSDQLADHCQVIGMFDITVNRALPANDMPAL